MVGTAARRAIASGPSIPEGALPKVASPGWFGSGAGYISRTKPGGVVRQASYALIDLVMVCGGAIGVFWISFGFSPIGSAIGATATNSAATLRIAYYGGFLVLYAALVVLAFIGQDLYRTPRGWNSFAEAASVAKAVGLATLVLILFIFSSGNTQISRLVVICSGLVNIATLSGWRYAKRKYVSRRLQRGIGTSRALIIGTNQLGQELAACFEQNCDLGYVFCGFLDSHGNGDSRVLGRVEDLRQTALAQFVDTVFVTQPADREMVKQVFVQAQSLRLNLHVVPDLYDGLGQHAPLRSVGGFPTLEIHGHPIPATGLAVKRTLDVVLALVAIILTAPLMAAAAFWIKLDSDGPIFYSALRVGRKGRRFFCHKLRTMFANAEAEKDKLRNEENERSGPCFKMKLDPRITRSGYQLRKYSIDELPQFFNVLAGDMSFVGPRPHPVDDFEHYSFEDMRRLEVKPGITGLWQISARSDPSFDTNMKLDLEYIEKWSLWLDLKILLKTIPALLRGEGS